MPKSASFKRPPEQGRGLWCFVGCGVVTGSWGAVATAVAVAKAVEAVATTVGTAAVAAVGARLHYGGTTAKRYVELRTGPHQTKGERGTARLVQKEDAGAAVHPRQGQGQ